MGIHAGLTFKSLSGQASGNRLQFFRPLLRYS
jgi:hypothetical protein